ncbi:hypothetical protein [Vibrio astriarenae]|uniref:hypothetical protein n=1 Tax=Vibrio astriarenae TaxID=1481923 RepID=UPI003736D7B6
MSNITYFKCWNSSLCIYLDTQENHRADFNRLLVPNLPSTKLLQQGRRFPSANRDEAIVKLKNRFDEAIAQGDSHLSLQTIFFGLTAYIKWCDKNNAAAFTQKSLEGYMAHEDTRVMLGEIKKTTYTRRRADLSVIFSKFLDLPYSYFDNVVVRGKNDMEPFESYTQSDLKQLLPFYRQLFKQTHKQFMADPERHINAISRVPTMIFNWQGRQYTLHSGISKMMCSASYLLAFYTYSNTNDLFSLKHPENSSTTLGDRWYSMPAFKRRAFKTIQLEMGGHNLEIPKYALDFFDNLLEASKLIYDGKDATLLQSIYNNKVRPLRNTILQGFLSRWVEKHFSFTDQKGMRLRPMISRFRETGAQITAYHQGQIASDLVLNNSHNTRRKHYSTGNKITNNGMMQDAMAIREEQARKQVNTEQAKQNLEINVLVIDEEYKANLPDLNRVPNGTSCSSPFGERSIKFTKKAITRGLAQEGEKLACSELLQCFGCQHQVIVQSETDIWCLLSFKDCIEESLYYHLDASHYKKNFEAIIRYIKEKILPNIDKKTLKQANIKLNDEGRHPIWDDSDSILTMIPKQTLREKI